MFFFFNLFRFFFSKEVVFSSVLFFRLLDDPAPALLLSDQHNKFKLH